MLGIDVADQDRFHDWSTKLMAVLGLTTSDPTVIDAAVKAIDEVTEYTGALADRARKTPDGSLMSALVAAADAGERLSARDLVTNTVMWMIAGHEPTMNMIANGAVVVKQHPQVLAELRANPALYETATTELIRYDGPVHM